MLDLSKNKTNDMWSHGNVTMYSLYLGTKNTLSIGRFGPTVSSVIYTIYDTLLLNVVFIFYKKRVNVNGYV